MYRETTEEQEISPSPEKDEKGETPFSLFSCKRQEKGLTTQDIAFYLKVSTRQIDQLEQADFSGLPGKTFIRCLIRSYAQHLDLTPENFLNYYEAHQPPQKENALSEPVVFISHAPTSLRHPKRLVFKLIAAIVVLNIGFVFVHYMVSHRATLSFSPVTEVKSHILSDNTLLTMSNTPSSSLSDALSHELLFKKNISTQNKALKGVDLDQSNA